MVEMDSSMILPALATLSVVLLLLGKLYTKLRRKFPIRVNCWFCNSDSSVPYNSSNSWYCPQCDQYNGFSFDGGYNRLLPEQFNEKLNSGSWCTKAKQKSSTPKNGLCRFCNINLELKIQQLSQFVPINKENYDEEVQLYSEQLERVYRLCSQCQIVLKKALNEKQDKFVTSQHQSFTGILDHSFTQTKQKERHSIYLCLTAMLSVGLLLSVIPYDWSAHLMAQYPPPDYILQLLSLVQEHVPQGGQLTAALLTLGVLVQLFDCLHMRDTTSLVNLLLWGILLSLTRITVQVEGLVSIVHMLAGIVFFITSVTERKNDERKIIAAVKPLQFQKLDGKSEAVPRNTVSGEVESTTKPESPKSSVSDPSPTPVPSFSHEPTPEDFGFGKLSVSSRRVTRSQTKPFQTPLYKSQPQTNLFTPKTVNLTPPRLQFDKTLDFQLPVTRSSSQSSGYVSLVQQKDFEEYRSPSVTADEFDSISQCGRGALTPYQSPFIPPTSLSHPFVMPFPHYQPFTVMQYSPPPFNKFYHYNNMQGYEPSLNLSSFSMQHSAKREGWFDQLKNSLYSLLFLFLITSNVAILWKVFGEEYFKFKT